MRKKECDFCGNKITNSVDFVRDRGKNGWWLHFDCWRRLTELRRRGGESTLSKYYEQFNRMIISYKNKQYKLYP